MSKTLLVVLPLPPWESSFPQCHPIAILPTDLCCQHLQPNSSHPSQVACQLWGQIFPHLYQGLREWVLLTWFSLCQVSTLQSLPATFQAPVLTQDGERIFLFTKKDFVRLSTFFPSLSSAIVSAAISCGALSIKRKQNTLPMLPSPIVSLSVTHSHWPHVRPGSQVPHSLSCSWHSGNGKSQRNRFWHEGQWNHSQQMPDKLLKLDMMIRNSPNVFTPQPLPLG